MRFGDGDKELFREFIDRATRLATKFEGKDRGWIIKNTIFGPIVSAQCYLEDYDGARKSLKILIGGTFESYAPLYIASLVLLKRYDDLESFLREDAVDARSRIYAWSAIALSKHKDGDKAGATKAIQSAIDFTRKDADWGGTPALQIKIAMDIKYVFSDKPGRSPTEIVDEVLKTLPKREEW
jgi:hypothetical protein